MSQEALLREEICTVGASLYNRGYTVGTAGNISARLEDGWLITPTDACLGRLDPANVAKVNSAGEWVSGERPSKTLLLHRQIYGRNPQVGGVVHTHSTHLVALTLAGVWRQDDILPPLTPYQVMKVGHIPLIDYQRPGAPEVARQVAEMADRVRGVMLERLGPVIWERSVSQASFALEELEETAKLWLLSRPQPTPLEPQALLDLERAFGVHW